MGFSILCFSVKLAENAEADIAPILDIKESDSILRIVRLNKIDGRPISVEEVYFIRDLVSDDEINNLRSLLNLNVYIEQGTISQNLY